MHIPVFVVLSALVMSSVARDVPGNLRSLYDSIRSRGDCSNKLATGFYSTSDGANTFSYCGDHLDDSGIIYLQGPRGQLVNMDVDCDGVQGGVGDDGRCASSTDTQSQTSFRSTVRGYDRGITDLNAHVHSYTVFGNVGNKTGYVNFDPREYGIFPLSVMAVVCNNRLVYGVWGDTNGDDGDRPMVGEAAISLATACYQDRINGNSGHDGNDVLYIAFRGRDAVPGQSANWGATTYEEFESSLEGLGDKLVAKIGTGLGVPLQAPLILLSLLGITAGWLVL